MTSAERALSLIDRTEANLKRIEELQSAFAAPVLNEWRYAIRHVVTMSSEGGAEFGKAEGHLKRAYFDSCDIVIDCQLDVIAAVHRRCLGYRKAVLEVAPGFTDWMETARRAQKVHREAQLKHGEEREAAFDSLSPARSANWTPSWTRSTRSPRRSPWPSAGRGSASGSESPARSPRLSRPARPSSRSSSAEKKP